MSTPEEIAALFPHGYALGWAGAFPNALGLTTVVLCLIDSIKEDFKTRQKRLVLYLGLVLFFFMSMRTIRMSILEYRDEHNRGGSLDIPILSSLGPAFSITLYLVVERYNSFTRGFKVHWIPKWIVMIGFSVFVFLWSLYWFAVHNCVKKMADDGTTVATGVCIYIMDSIELQIQLYSAIHLTSIAILSFFDLTFLLSLIQQMDKFKSKKEILMNGTRLHQLVLATIVLLVSLIDLLQTILYMAKAVETFSYDTSFATYALQYLAIAKLGVNIKVMLAENASNLHSQRATSNKASTISKPSVLSQTGVGPKSSSVLSNV